MTQHLLLLGAFPFPVPQGSQVYFAEQAAALRQAGARVSTLTHADVPRVLAPRRLRAGPSAMKPFADAALTRALLRASRRAAIDAVLAHNAEAALVALAARSMTRIPVIHVAHALWRHELPAYGPPAAHGTLARTGLVLDRFLTRRVDATLALCEAARAALARDARGPLRVIPPGLDPEPAPDDAELHEACARHGLEPASYALYAGNLDRYQELPDLTAAAEQAPDVPFVVVTHDPRGHAPSPLRVITADAPTTRLLTFAAGVCLLPRRIPGGFPIKLLNYIEAGRPVIARAEVADGFTHGESALLLERGDGPEVWAGHVRQLLRDRELADRIGAAGRALLERRHAWPRLAAETLSLVDAIRPA